MTPRDPLQEGLFAGREQFLARVADLRPELHRYCARMVGSLTDGEDIVQEALARAFYALPEYETLPPLRPWLFRIAHNRALDHLRRYEYRMGQPLAESDVAVSDVAVEEAPGPEDALAQEQALHAAVSRFVALAPAQRSCVILKDVLGHSLEEIAVSLELSVPAVKAALHRGRTGLRDRLASVDEAPARPASPIVARYAALFNARDWDGVRAMLADDVRLDLVARSQRTGRREVEAYFTNYERLFDYWHFVPAWLDGGEVLAVYRSPTDSRPTYFVELTHAGGQVTGIRDFHFVPYVAAEASITPSHTGE